MNAVPVTDPKIRTWRDIPQPVKPRAMSRSGRWRRAQQGVRGTALAICGVGALLGIWFLADALSGSPRALPEVAKTVPVRHLELKTSAGGVLDVAWLERTLALPRHVALMELDLERLRSRLLSHGQVESATIARQFPDRLVVRIAERTPVARLRVEQDGQPKDLLVAPDGFVFEGEGFDATMLAALPWLSGIALLPEGAGFKPISGMATVAQLLTDAQFSALNLYQAWSSVSLARLANDREIEVTTKNGTMIIFSATGDFFVQLATLDYLLEKLANTPVARARIDLTLGRNVPVLLEAPSAAADRRPASTPVNPPSFFSVLPTSRR